VKSKADRVAVVLNGNARQVTDELVESFDQLVGSGDLFLSRSLEEADGHGHHESGARTKSGTAAFWLAEARYRELVGLGAWSGDFTQGCLRRSGSIAA
jgi:hypothetical protein